MISKYEIDVAVKHTVDEVFRSLVHTGELVTAPSGVKVLYPDRSVITKIINDNLVSIIDNMVKENTKLSKTVDWYRLPDNARLALYLESLFKKAVKFIRSKWQGEQ